MFDSFSLRLNSRLFFGFGERKRLPSLLFEDSGGVLLLVSAHFAQSPPGAALIADLQGAAEGRSANLFLETLTGEPSPEAIDGLTGRYRGKGLGSVAAVGGGSVLDAGKAAAALLCEESGAADYLEGVGTRIPSGRTLPLTAVPTTAGTGSEATKNAVLSRPGSSGFKKSLRHDNYVPPCVVIDPELTLGVPREIRSFCGIDALSQLMESFLSPGITPPVEALCAGGLSSLVPALDRLITEPEAVQEREIAYSLSYGAYFSGVALAHAGLGAVHGMAGPLGGYAPVAHGRACALFLRPVMALTWSRAEPSLERRMNRLAQLAGQKNFPDLLEMLDRWETLLDLGNLTRRGLTPGDCSSLAKQCGNKSHPLTLTLKDFEKLFLGRM